MGMLQRLRHIHIFLLKHMPKFFLPKKTPSFNLNHENRPTNKNQACRLALYPQLNKKQVCHYRCHHLQFYYILGVASKCQWSLRMTWIMLRIGDLHLPPASLEGGPHPNHIYTYIHTYIEVKGLALTVGEAFWVWGHIKTGRGILFWIKTSTFSGQMFWRIS